MRARANLIVLGVLFLLVAFGLLLNLLPSRARDVRGSVMADSPWGRSVVFELIRELGFEARTWTDSPGRLPEGGGLLVLEELPELPPGYRSATGGAEAGAPDAPAAPGARATATSRRLRDPLHYLRFAEEGGTLLMGSEEGTFDFLVDVFDLYDALELELVEISGDDDVPEVLFASGEELEVAWVHEHRFRPLRSTSAFEVVLADGRGEALALRYEVGRGSIVLLSDPLDFLDNLRIEDPGNALLFVRLLEELAAPGDTVYFDEYVLGGWTPDTALELAFAPHNFVFTTHLLLLLLFLVWSTAWTREFPRDPIPLGAVSAIVRARGFAGMLARARRWDLLARMLRAGVLRRLASRTGVRLEADGAAAADSWDSGGVLQRKTVHSVLSPLLPSGSERARKSREAIFLTGKIATKADLEQLAVELARIEKQAILRVRTRRGDNDTGNRI